MDRIRNREAENKKRPALAGRETPSPGAKPGDAGNIDAESADAL